VCFLSVKIFCCYVYFISKETRKHAVFNDKKWKFEEQYAKMWENIAAAKRYSRPRAFNITGASAPVSPAVPTSLRNSDLCRANIFAEVLSPNCKMRREM